MSKSGRQYERVDSRVPVQLVDGTEGETRNLSPHGVFFVVDAEMDAGDDLEFTLDFDTPAGKVHLHCVGEVVRTQRVDGRIGVAVKILESRLERRDHRSPHEPASIGVT